MKDFIYQEYDKSYMAGFLGLPANTFYRWSYVRWAKVRTKFISFQDDAWAWWMSSACKTHIPLGRGTRRQSRKEFLMGEIWSLYKVEYEKKHGVSLNKKLGVKEK